MKHLHTFESFLNEASTRFLDFKTALAKAGIELQWLDELKDVPREVKEKVSHFGNTNPQDIAVIFEKDAKGKFDEISKMGAGTMIYGEDPEAGRFVIINAKTS
jgi:hypothetical protein